MRKPSEYIASAVRGLRDRSMTDCAATLVHGAETAKVVRTASLSTGADPVSGDEPTESVRVIALAADFPSIDKGDAATLDGSVRIVTGVRTDVSGASRVIGLSDVLEERQAVFCGVRGARTVRMPVGILAACTGYAEDVTDGYAPTTVRAWTIIIQEDDWSEADPPRVGDEFRFEHRGDQRVKVARVKPGDGIYVVSARSR